MSGRTAIQAEISQDDHHCAGHIHALLPTFPLDPEPLLLLQISQAGRSSTGKNKPFFFFTYLLCISNSNSFTFYVFHQISCSLLEGSSIAYKVTRPFASANSCLDPILYFLSGQETRNEIKKTITKSTKTVNVDSRSTTEF